MRRPSTLAAARATLPLALLVTTVVLAGLIAAEAHATWTSHRVTAEHALRDYATVAAWEFVASARDRLGAEAESALDPVTRGHASSPYELLVSPEVVWSAAQHVLVCPPAAEAPRFAVRLDLRDGSVNAAGPAGIAPLSPEIVAWLRDTLAARTRRFRPEERFEVLQLPSSASDQLLLYGVRFAEHGAPLAAFGFTTCREAVGSQVMGAVMRRHPLLPASVTSNAPNDSLLSLAVTDASGRVWYASAAAEGSPYTGIVALEGFGVPLAVRATLRPGAGERLLTGRPLHSRLPLLFGLLALTAALSIVALWQLRREQELSRLRADFTSSVSHELRTPLAQILLYGETLALGRVRGQGARDAAAATIVNEARRLMQMVENVLQFSRSSRGRVDVRLEATPLAPLLRAIVDAFAPLAAESGARLAVVVHGDPVAYADPLALRQIVLNLLDNAVKYGTPGQVVHVDAAATGGRARVSVDDEGQGIPPRDRERIWSPYVRLRRDRGRSRGGSGIGLAVVRDLARAQGGDAWVGAGRTGGARFVIDLPAPPPVL